METIDKIIESEPEKAYAELMKKYNSGGKTEPDVLWRLAKACYNLSIQMDRKNSKKKDVVLEGRDYAQKAATIDSSKFAVIQWAAIMTGSATDFLPPKDKIEQGGRFKDYLDTAIIINPKEFTLLHMRGRYAFAVAELTWLEKKIAIVLYKTAPEATFDEALQDFLAANRVKPKWIENLLYVGRCYMKKKDYKNAAKFLREAIEVKPKDDGESDMIQDAKDLLKKAESKDSS